MTQTLIRDNFTSAKVLVIEENAEQWALIQGAMHQCLPEISLVWASSAQQAIDQLEAWYHQEWEAPKLILQDLYLPDREEGWALLKQIKAMPFPFNRIPVVMLSKPRFSNDIQKAYEAGIAAYLVKPVEFDQWLRLIEELRVYWWETAALLPIQYNLQE